jgi:AcrR family transcriptional regulator
MTTPHKSEMRRKQILKAAEKVFAQKGYQESTISDVAREAKVSDATIYEYFPSKEDLLFSIPGEMTRKYKDEILKILSYVRTCGDKLRCVIQHYLWFYETHSDYASVAMLILKQNRNFLDKAAYQEVREHAQLILHLIEKGIKSGEFRSDINPYLVRATILGTIEHLVIRRVLLGKPERLVPFTDQFWAMISGGITRPKEDNVFTVRFSSGQEGSPQKEDQAAEQKRKPAGDKKN